MDSGTTEKENPEISGGDFTKIPCPLVTRNYNLIGGGSRDLELKKTSLEEGDQFSLQQKN